MKKWIDIPKRRCGRTTTALVLLTIILAGGMMAFPWFDTGAGLPVPVLSAEEATNKDATAYAERFETTVDEAERRLGLQSAIGSLETALEQGEPNTFGGLWIDNDDDYKVVVAFTSDGEETITSYVADGDLEDIVETRTVDTALAALRTIKENTKSLIRGQLATRAELDLLLEENRIELYVTDAEDLQTALEDNDRALHNKVTVVGVSELSKVKRSPTSTQGCAWTSSFPMMTSHALSDSVSRTPAVLRALSLPSTVLMIGSMTWAIFNSRNLKKLDFRYGGSQDVMWANHAYLTPTHMMFDGTTDRPITGAVERSDQAVNSWVCKYGISTGYGCSTIRSKDYDMAGQQGTWHGTWIRVRDNSGPGALLQSGDSGGPWFYGTKAYGISTAATDDGDGIYMAINYIDDMDLTVMIAPDN